MAVYYPRYQDSLIRPVDLLADSDGHDSPRLIDELVPGVGAVVDDVVVGFDARQSPRAKGRP